jgi:hypothetical protein
MKPSVRKVLESRDACENLQRVTYKMDRFSGHCPSEPSVSENINSERDETIIVPNSYKDRHHMHYGITEAILNVITLGLFSRVDSFIKHM